MKFSACFAALFGAVLFLLPASAAPVNAGHARVELISEREAALPGETVYAALKMDLDNGWHVYWRNAGDAGLPPQVLVQPGSDIKADAVGGIVWPLPHLLPVVAGEIMDYGYDEEVVLHDRIGSSNRFTRCCLTAIPSYARMLHAGSDWLERAQKK